MPGYEDESDRRAILNILKHILRKKREEVRIKFTQTEAYTVWNHCYDAEQHDYSIPKFLRKLNTLYDGEINRAEWNRFMSYHCQTKYIDTVLAQLLENEKQTQDGIVNFQYNNYGRDTLRMYFLRHPYLPR